MEQQGLHEGSMEKDLISHCKRECKLRRRKEIKKGLCRDKEQAKQQISSALLKALRQSLMPCL